MKKPLRLAVIGTGMMARMRLHSFLETGEVCLVGVASYEAERAKQFAAAQNCDFSTDRFETLADCSPDMMLIEVPHLVQSEAVSWALERKYHLLIGSCPAMSIRELDHIRKMAETNRLIVEGGFEARYKEVWKQTRHMIRSQAIGEVCAIQATACWGARTDSWYYDQEASGGMPLTHMTYAFLNPLNWIFGLPRKISAFSNAKGTQRPGMVNEVTCSASLEYDNHIPCNLLASYLHHPGAPDWKLFIHGTSGALEVFPGEFGGGEIVHHAAGQEPVCLNFENAPNPFRLQADTFIEAARNGSNYLQNTPAQSMEDLQVVSAILESIKTAETVSLK